MAIDALASGLCSMIVVIGAWGGKPWIAWFGGVLWYAAGFFAGVRDQ